MLVPEYNYIPPDDAGPLSIADLIKLLQEAPPDLIPVIGRDEGGFSPIVGIKQVSLLENVNTESYYGPHDYVESITEQERVDRKLVKSDFIVLLK